MKVEVGKVTIVRISDLMKSHRLDPVRVTLDDIELGKGRITIECYGRAWSAYWGAMGKKTIAQFFVSCDNGYLISNLASAMDSTRYSATALVKLAEKTICERRRGSRSMSEAYLDLGDLTKAKARELYYEANNLALCETPDACWFKSELLSEIFGDEWFHYIDGRAQEHNPEYDYLSRICNAVREGLQELAKAEPVGAEA